MPGLRLITTGLLGLACSSPAPSPSVAPTSLGWVTAVAEQPSTFDEIMARTDRDGWIALHAHDYPTAFERFSLASGPTARIAEQRAALGEWLLQRDLERLVAHAAENLFAGWEERGSLPGGAEQVRALAARCAGKPAKAPQEWSSLSGEGPLTAELVAALPPGPIADRLALHVEILAGGPPKPLIQVAHKPLLTLQVGDFERTWFDPCVHATLGHHQRRSLEPSLSATIQAWDSPEASLFAGWLDPSDLADQLSGDLPTGTSAVIARELGLPSAPATADDPQQAREEARALDSRLDLLRARLLHEASAETASLVNDLGIIDRFKVELLVARARADLLADRPKRAVATLSMARDVTQRGISPLNSPSLFALLAEGHLRTGHVREALDALQPLSQARPETVGVREFIGDLSVLRGLDRDGDSKEL